MTRWDAFSGGPPQARVVAGLVVVLVLMQTMSLFGGRKTMENLVVGGGCFWCIEAVFADLEGVESVQSGYSGGTLASPTYRQVCNGDTGHAEVVKITFDPSVISVEDLLRVFFTVHDPTTLNQQGADQGTQYRSVIFFQSEEQKTAAAKIISQVAAESWYRDPMVTEVVPFKEFYQAEDYHQSYFALNAQQPYCRAVISPKVKKFREMFQSRLKKSPPPK